MRSAVMAMTRNLLVLSSVVALTTGCTSKQEEPAKPQVVDDKKNEDSSDPLATLYGMIQEDAAGDGKSVIWDGESAVTEDDAQDAAGVDDGGYGFETFDSYVADQLIECVYPTGFEQVSVDAAQPDKCHFAKDDDELFVSPVDYEAETALYDGDDNYIEIDNMGLREDTTKYFTNYKTYFGMKELGGVTKAGYVLIFESNLADRSYKVEVYGLNNMSAVKVEALEIMNQFEVLFYESPTDNIPEGASPEAEIPVVAPIDDAPEETVSGSEYDEYSKELLMNALSCDEEDAETILRNIGYVNNLGVGNIKLPLTSVEKVEKDSEYWQSYSEENDIVIEDADSVKYYLLLTGRYSVDMAMKLETEEIVYAIVR